MLYGNLVRVAVVWMDEWQDFFFKFNPGSFFFSNSSLLGPSMVCSENCNLNETTKHNEILGKVKTT